MKKEGARKICPWRKRIRSGNAWANWMGVSQWIFLGYSWHCKAPLNNLWLITGTGRRVWRLEEKTEGDPGNYRSYSFTVVAGKVAEELILNTISKHNKDKEISRTRQHSFAKRKSHSTNLVDELRAVGSCLPVFQYLLSLALSLIRSS